MTFASKVGRPDVSSPDTGSPRRSCVLTGCLLWQVRYEDEDEDEGPQPDPTLEQGAPIPVRLQGGFPPELASTPLEDIDSYYHNQRVSNLAKISSSIRFET